MKFINDTSETIIFANEVDFATLVEVNDATVVYKISFEIDLNEATKKNNSFSGKIYISKAKKTTLNPVFNSDIILDKKQEQPIKKNGLQLANKKIIESIQKLTPSRKENAVRNDENIILTKNFSILEFTSLDAIEKSKKNKFSIEELQVNLSEISKIKNIRETIPNYQLSTLNSNQLLTENLQTARLNGVDPASLAVKTKGIKNVSKTVGGIFVDYKTLNPVQNSIISQRQETPQISNSSLTSTIEKVVKTTVKVNLEIILEKNKINSLNELYFEIEMYDTASRPTANKQITVFHKKNLDIFLTPKSPPKITSFYRRNSDGKIVLFIKQNDENATGISLFYKEIDKKITSEKYFYLGNYELKKTDGEKKIEINKTLNKKIILRALSNYQNDRNCVLFDSVIIDENKNITESNTKIVYDTTLTYQINQDNTITVSGTVNEIGIFTILLYKKTIATGEDVLVYGPYKLEQDKSFNFKDNDLKKDSYYEYYIKLIKKDGSLVDTNSSIIVQNKTIQANILESQIIASSNTVSSDKLNVEFELKTTLEQKNITLVIENFKSLGIYDLYKDLFDSTDISTSFVYRVIRTNLQTGQEEDFGILLNNKFNDSVLRERVNVKKIESGYSYKYKIYTYFRTPFTLLPKLQINQTYKNTTYSFYPYISRHPFVLKQGTLVTENTLKEQHSENDYSFGPTGAVIEYDADFTKILPTIKEVKAVNLNKTMNMLTWTIDGNLEKIDHFIITLTRLGVKSVIGGSHNISDSNSFVFYDILTDGEVGEVYYSLIPVYFDYSLGQEISSNNIII